MSDEEVNQNSFCRFCLGKLKQIIEKEERDETLAEMNSIFNLEIYEKDAWPKRICTCCKEKAKSCIDFIQNIKDGERKLLELFGEKFQDQKKEIIFSEDLTKVELKQEVLVHAVKLSSGGEGEDVLVTDKSDRTSSEWRTYSLEESETDTTDKIDFQQNTKNVKKKCGRKRELSKQVSDNKNKRTIKIENESVVKKYLSFKCEICTHQAKSYFALKYHFRDTHGIKGYLICCETKFTHLGILAGHLKKHFDPECFKCSKCCKVLSNQKSLMTHIQDCMKDPKTYAYICEVCSKAHPSSRALYCHRRKMHSTEADKTHRCSECSKSYLTPSELKYHYLYSHDTKKHSVCDICGKGFRTKWQAKTHLKIAHLNKGLPKVKCDRCGGYYTSDFTLKQHQRRCQADPVTCNYCEKTYCNEVALKKHIKYAHDQNGKKTFPCDMCSKTFSTKRLLIDHTAKHSNIPKHKCTYCEMQFYTLSAKYAHQRVHHPIENAAAKIRKP